MIVVSGVLTHTYIRWHASTHLHTTKMLRLTHPNESGFLFYTVARGWARFTDVHVCAGAVIIVRAGMKGTPHVHYP